MLQTRSLSHCWHTLSRSYSVILPSSLTMFHSNALGFSPCPPELVCSTVCFFQRLAAFLVSIGSLPSACASSSHLRIDDLPDLPRRSPYMLKLESNNQRSYLSPPLHHSKNKYRNINLLSIDYAFRPRLRCRLTLGGLPLPQETLGFRRICFSHILSLLMLT